MAAKPPPEKSMLDWFLETRCPLPHAAQRIDELGPGRAMQSNRVWFAKMWQMVKQSPQHPVDTDFLLLLCVREPLDEATACYVLGRFLACVAMAASAVELALGFELRARSVDIEMLTLGGLISEAENIQFVEKGSPLDKDLWELNTLRIEALHFSDIKTAKEMSDPLFYKAIGTGGPSTIQGQPYEGPLREKARTSIHLMERTLGNLWQEASVQLEAEKKPG
jgi:hypothetical protein